MTLKRVVVIGSGGQVARALVQGLRGRATDILLTSSSGKTNALPLDLSQPDSIRALFPALESRWGNAPVEIFLPGALTHVERCEEERELCHRINSAGPRIVAEECARRGHSLTYFSTEYVFGAAEFQGGAVGPFAETDPPAPTSWYGECKLEAEKAVLGLLGPEQALVVRTTMVFSWDLEGMNFLMQYIRHLEALRAGKSAVFRVPEDQISTPTYAPALAEATCLLREKGVGGIVNLVGSDCLSRKELVERVVLAFGFDRESSLGGFEFLKTSALAQKAKRPLRAGLRSEKAEGLGVKVWSLDEAFTAIRALRV